MSTSDLLQRVRARRALPPPALRLALRQAAGATRRDIADALGVSETTVWRWEKGLRTPQRQHLEAYVELLRKLERIAS